MNTATVWCVMGVDGDGRRCIMSATCEEADAVAACRPGIDTVAPVSLVFHEVEPLVGEYNPHGP